jgi:RNase P subunit RPR2
MVKSKFLEDFYSKRRVEIAAPTVQEMTVRSAKRRFCTGGCHHRFVEGDKMIFVANEKGRGKHGYYCQACGSSKLG